MKTLALLTLLLGFSTGAIAGSAADDRATSQRVRSALHTDLGGAARLIRVDSYGGTVQLSGAVASRKTIDHALLSASDVDGVNHVMDAMVTAPRQTELTID